MPRDVFARIIRGDMNNPFVAQGVSWLQRIHDRNHFDPDVLTYPSMALVQAYEKQTGRPLLYVPVHKVYMVESLGPNPDINGFDMASALAQVIKCLAWDAPKDGVGELYFPTTDESIDSFCRDHGFTRMLYDTGRKQSAPHKDDVDAPTGDNASPVAVEETPVLADMPHYKFKVFR